MAFISWLTFLVLSFLLTQRVISESIQEKQALLTFLKQIPHENRLQWNESDSACNWFGVECDANRSSVHSLRLPGTGLVGQIPSGSLGRLSQLRVLSLRSNRLSGQIPSDFSNLTHLRSLYLQHNEFSGEFPTSITQLTSLIRLDISSNNFTGSIPFSVNNLTLLTGLFLGNNRFSGNLPSISVDLTDFNVSDNNLNGSIPSSLSRFPADSFTGNVDLCGGPLKPCKSFFVSPSPSPSSVNPSDLTKKKSKLSTAAIVLISIACGLVGLLLLALLLFFCLKKRRGSNDARATQRKPGTTATTTRSVDVPPAGTSSSKDEVTGTSSGMGGETERNKLVFTEGGVYSFDLEDLLRASAEVLGKGSVGTSYKAVLEEGTTVVVKRLKDVVASKKEFESQMEIVGKIKHPNVIPLRAFYYSKDEKLLVFDFMPTGSLSALLHDTSLHGIMQTLHSFYLISGLQINLGKTSLFLDGNDLVTTSALAETYHIQHGSLPVRYLGLPLTTQKLRSEDYQVLIDRVRMRISSWIVRQLSFAGRLQLIRSIVHGIVNFWSSVFPLPRKCLKEVERLCASFLWSGLPDSNRASKVAWSTICTPLQHGGLGLKSLKDTSIIFGLKLIWLLFAKSGSLWVAWVHKNLIRGKVFWELSGQGLGCWIWKKLLLLRDIARPLLVCHLASGKKAMFWHDNWTGEGPLLGRIGANGPRVSGIPKLATVYDALQVGYWRNEARRHPICRALRLLVPTLPALTSTEVDRFLWCNSSAGPPSDFSSSKTWDRLQPQRDIVPWHKSVWFTLRIPKHAFVMWLLMRDRLHTKDKLIGWGYQVAPTCLLCGEEDETKSHLFFNCSFSTQVWKSFFDHEIWNSPSELGDIVMWVRRSSTNKSLRDISTIIFHAVVYYIWRERNARLHQVIPTPVANLIRQIKVTLRARLLGLDKAARLRPSVCTTSSLLQL